MHSDLVLFAEQKLILTSLRIDLFSMGHKRLYKSDCHCFYSYHIDDGNMLCFQDGHHLLHYSNSNKLCQGMEADLMLVVYRPNCFISENGGKAIHLVNG